MKPKTTYSHRIRRRVNRETLVANLIAVNIVTLSILLTVLLCTIL